MVFLDDFQSLYLIYHPHEVPHLLLSRFIYLLGFDFCSKREVLTVPWQFGCLSNLKFPIMRILMWTSV
jgi:hypothetical protein